MLRAIDAIRDITGSGDVNTIGFCAGGIITTGVLNHLPATRDARIHSASFAVTMLDFGQRARSRPSPTPGCCPSPAPDPGGPARSPSRS